MKLQFNYKSILVLVLLAFLGNVNAQSLETIKPTFKIINVEKIENSAIYLNI